MNAELQQKIKNPPYDTLYASIPNNILWGSEPSHLLHKLSDYNIKGNALDIGCGDGVNAMFLESTGFDVEGYDISPLALNGLKHRFNMNGVNMRGSYSLLDISMLENNRKYDVIVSCGLYQCLNRNTRMEVHKRINNKLKQDGVILFSCLTNSLPLPSDHLTEGLELADLQEIKGLFADFSIEYYKEDIIQDIHEPLVGTHKHSIVWVIARNHNQSAIYSPEK